MTAELETWLRYALVAPFPLMLIWAMATDLHRFEIPNRIPVILAAGYLAASLSLGEELLIILRQCGIAAAFLLAGVVLFARGIMGGGDVKLLAATVPWLAPGQLLVFLFWMAMAGGFAGLLALGLRRAPASGRLAENAWFARFKAANKIPYGVAIGCAGLITLPNIPLLAN
jgi:prepilin peptidase CpaA